MAECELSLGRPEPAWVSPALPASSGTCEVRGGSRVPSQRGAGPAFPLRTDEREGLGGLGKMQGGVSGRWHRAQQPGLARLPTLRPVVSPSPENLPREASLACPASPQRQQTPAGPLQGGQ